MGLLQMLGEMAIVSSMHSMRKEFQELLRSNFFAQQVNIIVITNASGVDSVFDADEIMEGG